MVIGIHAIDMQFVLLIFICNMLIIMCTLTYPSTMTYWIRLECYCSYSDSTPVIPDYVLLFASEILVKTLGTTFQSAYMTLSSELNELLLQGC